MQQRVVRAECLRHVVEQQRGHGGADAAEDGDGTSLAELVAHHAEREVEEDVDHLVIVDADIDEQTVTALREQGVDVTVAAP